MRAWIILAEEEPPKKPLGLRCLGYILFDFFTFAKALYSLFFTDIEIMDENHLILKFKDSSNLVSCEIFFFMLVMYLFTNQKLNFLIKNIQKLTLFIKIGFQLTFL